MAPSAPYHPVYRYVVAALLQLLGTSVYRHPVFLLVPAPVGDYYGHYHGSRLLCESLSSCMLHATVHECIPVCRRQPILEGRVHLWLTG